MHQGTGLVDMYHALHIQEIVLNIFGHCYSNTLHSDPDSRLSTATLAALARTCHAFKEPALDVVWSELIDLTALPRCIPEACCAAGRRVRAEFVAVQSYGYLLLIYSTALFIQETAQ